MEIIQQKVAFIQANGDPITIIRSGGNISTYARFVKGRQLLSPYEINFVRFMLFMPSSGLQRGDLIQNATTGEQSFVSALQDRTLQGVVSGVYTELYNVNYPSVPVQHNLPADVDQYGNPVPGTGGWTTVATLPMNIEHVNGNVPYKDGLLLADTTYRIILQTAIMLQLIPTPDRIVIDGRNFQVSDINTSIAPGLQVVQVKTDTRT
jgi:hypothetical protein